MTGALSWSQGINSLFYPSASLAFLPTTAFPDMVPDFVDFLKLRVGYGSSAGFPSPFRTRQVLGSNAISFISDDQGIISTNAVGGVTAKPKP